MWFEEHPHETKVVVDEVLEFLKALFFEGGNSHDRPLLWKHGLGMLELVFGGDVDLVDGDHRFLVHPIHGQRVHDLFSRGIMTQGHDGAGVAKGPDDGAHLFGGQVSLLHRTPHIDAALVGANDEHGRTLFVEPESRVVELTIQDVKVAVLERIDDEQHHVSRTDDTEDLLASAFAL